MPATKTINPFYVLLIPAGALFVVTTFAYSYMAFQAVNAVQAETGRHAGHLLFQWLRAHGSVALLVEVAVLGVLTVGAIATDSWWSRSATNASEAESQAGN